ncbi:hypothetical protein GCM10027614_32480 [Micromonospora vulcania]
MQRMNAAEVAPKAYQAVLGLEKYVQTNVDHTVLELVKLRASMLNGCAYCVDMHSRDALGAGESSRRLFAVAAWREAPFFDERERAALALTDAVTKLGEHGVPDDVGRRREGLVGEGTGRPGRRDRHNQRMEPTRGDDAGGAPAQV